MTKTATERRKRELGADNSHTNRTPYCILQYWIDNTAAGIADDWTHCSIEIHGHPHFPKFKFTDEQKEELGSFVHALMLVWQIGQADKAAEIRKVIGA